MAQKIIIPRLGQTMTEGVIAKWYQPDGARVESGDDVYEMEYDKSTATVQAKKGGILRHLHEEGESIGVGQPVGIVLQEGETFEQGMESVLGKTPDGAPATEEKTGGAEAEKKAAGYDADTIVIGAGPGGYVAAMKLAMLGASVILVEKDTVGGTCLNRGCIPTKAILHCAEVYEQAKNSAEIGVVTKEVSLDLRKVDAFRKKVINTLVKGVGGLLAARKVSVIEGSASFVSAHEVAVCLKDGSKKRISAPNIVIAAGSKSAAPPIPGIDGKNVITSTEALCVENLPGSIVIIGGGVIGMEIGSAYAEFGVKVTVVEALDRVLPNMDAEISAEFFARAKKKMEIFTSSRVERMEDTEDQKKVVFTRDGNSYEVVADQVLVAIGRTPDLEGLGLENAGIEKNGRAVAVDDNFETTAAGVYCIGDANAKTMLAHTASAQAIFVAEHIMGKTPEVALNIIPSCIYTDPEIASVGLTEEQAKEQGIAYRVGKFPFRANGRSLVLGKADGFVKIIGSEDYHEILGVHIIGPYATELIAECAMAIKLEGCVEDIANTIHAHPTVSEGVMEAAEKFLGGAIHSL